MKNESNRGYILKNGADEGKVSLSFDNGVYIQRKKREGKTDYKDIKKEGSKVDKPQAFLNSLFTELQINPVKFLAKNQTEQNNAILDLIDFKWDMNFIKEHFGEIPEVNYEQNILNVLYDIQSEQGPFFMKRRDTDRDRRHKDTHLKDVLEGIPDKFNYKLWKDYDIGQDYEKLEKIKDENQKATNAKEFIESFDSRLDSIKNKRDKDLLQLENNNTNKINEIDKEINELKNKIANLEAEKTRATDATMEKAAEVVNSFDKEKIKLEELLIRAKTRVDNTDFVSIDEMKDSIEQIKKYQKLVPIYEQAMDIQADIKKLNEQSAYYDKQIEKARELPGYILENSIIPIPGITVKDGIALINGLPVANLSDGEKLDLCVDIAAAGIGELKVLLIDGCEKLDTQSQEQLFKRCKEKDIQFIATRTSTEDEELKIIYI